MSIILIPNQPVIFEDTTDPCKCTSAIQYKQLVNLNDETQFQIKLEPCDDSEELVTDPTFDVYPGSWTLGGGYTIADGLLCRDDSVSTDCTTQVITGADTPMILQITAIITQGCGTITLVGLDDIFDSGELEVGTHVLTFYFYNSNAPTLNICLCDNSCITFVGIKQILAPRVSLFTEDGVWQNTWNGDDINENTETNPDGAFTYSEDSMTFNLHWSDLDLPNGCYYICLIDPCDTTNNQNSVNVLPNGDFATTDDWVATVNASTTLGIAAGVCDYLSTNDSGTGEFENTATDLVVGLCYDVSYSINNIVSPASPLLTRVRFTCGPFIGSWQSVGGATYTETFTYVSGNVIMEFESTGSGTHRMTIDNVVIVVGDECLVCSYNSNTFKYGTFECTNLINACNNENGMGFVFPLSGFSPRIRLESKYVLATYKAERSSFVNSAGNRTVQYFNRRKARAFKIEMVPEYVHDFLSTLMGYDHLWIGSTEYFVTDDEYTPIYTSADDEMGQVIINIEEKLQLVENTNCGAEENSCEIIP